MALWVFTEEALRQDGAASVAMDGFTTIRREYPQGHSNQLNSKDHCITSLPANIIVNSFFPTIK